MTATATSDADLLLIAPSNFGYHTEIIEALRRRGRLAAWFEDRPHTSAAAKAVIRVNPHLLEPASRAYFARLSASLDPLKVRDVLVIKGESLSRTSIELMRRRLPNAKFTLYFWDSYKNMPRDTPDKVALFDRCLSFDPADVESDPRLIYRPNYFIRTVEKPLAQADTDLFFVGTIHGDRYQVLRKLTDGLPPGIRFERRMYFQSKTVLQLRRRWDPRLLGARMDEFTFVPMSRQDVRAWVMRSRACVDIERSIQTGFAPRTIEIIGSGRKLVTTNPMIRNAEFYDETNIQVIDRENPRIDPEFFRTPFRPLPRDVIKKLEIDTWLDDILGVTLDREEPSGRKSANAA